MHHDRHHVSGVSVTTTNDTARILRNGSRRKTLGRSGRLIGIHRKQRSLPLLDVAARNLTSRATANTEIEQDFPMLIEPLALFLGYLRHGATQGHRRGVRLYP